MEDYKKLYEDHKRRAKQKLAECGDNEGRKKMIYEIFPELKESEDEKIREQVVYAINQLHVCECTKNKLIAWLEKQGEQKEINFVEILKHYPRETELYSPLYGKLWLAEVDEEHEIITCYKRRLSEGCKRASLVQENTVCFYANGTTGLPDYSISKDCMLFLYNDEKQDRQKTIWSEEDEENRIDVIKYPKLI